MPSLFSRSMKIGGLTYRRKQNFSFIYYVVFLLPSFRLSPPFVIIVFITIMAIIIIVIIIIIIIIIIIEC